MGYFRSDIRIGNGNGVVFNCVGSFQCVDPHRPVLAAHYFDGSGDLLLGGRLDGDLGNGVVPEVDSLVGVGFSGGLEHGGICHVADSPSRSGKAVYNGVHLAEVSLDDVDDLFLAFVGIRVAIDGLCIQSVSLRELLERLCVVPAGGSGLAAAGRAVEHHAQSRRAAGIRQRNTACKSVSHGASEHQHLLRFETVILRLPGLNILYFRLHHCLAAHRMSRGADESSYLGFNYHNNTPSPQYCKTRVRYCALKLKAAAIPQCVQSYFII